MNHHIVASHVVQQIVSHSLVNSRVSFVLGYVTSKDVYKKQK